MDIRRIEELKRLFVHDDTCRLFLPLLFGFMNEGKTLVQDLSQDHNDGTVYNVVPRYPGFYWDGVESNYIEIPDSGSLDIINAITIRMWLYSQNGNEEINYFSKDYAYRIKLWNGYIYFQLSLDGHWAANWIVSNSPIPTNKWVCITCTYDKSLPEKRGKIYINKVLDNEDDFPNGENINVSSYSLKIGHE